MGFFSARPKRRKGDGAGPATESPTIADPTPPPPPDPVPAKPKGLSPEQAEKERARKEQLARETAAINELIRKSAADKKLLKERRASQTAPSDEGSSAGDGLLGARDFFSKTEHTPTERTFTDSYFAERLEERLEERPTGHGSDRSDPAVGGRDGAAALPGQRRRFADQRGAARPAVAAAAAPAAAAAASAALPASASALSSALATELGGGGGGGGGSHVGAAVPWRRLDEVSASAPSDAALGDSHPGGVQTSRLASGATSLPLLRPPGPDGASREVHSSRAQLPVPHADVLITALGHAASASMKLPAVAHEAAAAQEAFGGPSRATLLSDISIAQLGKALEGCTTWFFSGHGDMMLAGEMVLAFAEDGEAGVVQTVSVASLVATVRPHVVHGRLKLVVLTGCNTLPLGIALRERAFVPYVVCWETQARLLLIASDCFRLRLIASGCFRLLLVASGCFWLLLVASGCFWLLRVAPPAPPVGSLGLLATSHHRALPRSPRGFLCPLERPSASTPPYPAPPPHPPPPSSRSCSTRPLASSWAPSPR